jgi:hypothetical protein
MSFNQGTPVQVFTAQASAATSTVTEISRNCSPTNGIALYFTTAALTAGHNVDVQYSFDGTVWFSLIRDSTQPALNSTNLPASSNRCFYYHPVPGAYQIRLALTGISAGSVSAWVAFKVDN